MMAYMQKWVRELGPKQHEILGRLRKDAVRNHQNIRRSGEGGPPEAEGTFAANQAHQVQHNIQNYVSGIPVVGQASQFLGNFSGGPGGGQRREMPGIPEPSGPSFPGSPPGGHMHPSGPPPPPAGSHFMPPTGPPPSFPSPGGGGYAPSYPQSPPAFPDYNPADYGGYQAPPGPPPPGGPGYYNQAPYGAAQGPPTNYPNFPSGPPPPGGYNQYGGSSGW